MSKRQNRVEADGSATGGERAIISAVILGAWKDLEARYTVALPKPKHRRPLEPGEPKPPTTRPATAKDRVPNDFKSAARMFFHPYGNLEDFCSTIDLDPDVARERAIILCDSHPVSQAWLARIRKGKQFK